MTQSPVKNRIVEVSCEERSSIIEKNITNKRKRTADLASMNTKMIRLSTTNLEEEPDTGWKILFVVNRT
jgi:hypothetical protein